jgi:flagellar hook assembly protein FlgD
LKLSAIIVCVLIFSLSAPDVLTKMVEAVYIPENTVRIEGLDESGKPLIIEYDKLKDTVSRITVDGEEQKTSTLKDLFLRLFFFPADHTKPETMTKAVESLTKLLKNNGIRTDTTTLSVDGEKGKSAISIGKEKRFSSANELVILKSSGLPAYLLIEKEKTVFSDYHKSVLPAVFPGRIDFYTEGEMIKTWTFYRPEFK